DYRTPGVVSSGCSNTDMSSLDTVTSTTPVDLAKLAYVTGSPLGNTTAPTTLPGGTLTGTLNSNGQIIPMPVSGAGGSYSQSNGYWLQAGYPTETGCLKIEIQNNSNGWTDVTSQILSQGYTGRNIHPMTSLLSPLLPALPGSEYNPQGPT